MGVVLIKITPFGWGFSFQVKSLKQVFELHLQSLRLENLALSLRDSEFLGVTEERLRILAVGIAFVTILATPLLYGNASSFL